ncbi:CPBP family intramembrane metalloprotease (plasmid) [Gordonia polyisoprenivorans]|uniref:CPBP family glutamic-type intramembrane protease n=1 Tax=Gordonia polyisoprenivorans TaxID=84595 RepID=UPI0022345A22|nr:CPBP family intramembrane metalloprotease [Gordonia polyisoprenivorans]
MSTFTPVTGGAPEWLQRIFVWAAASVAACWIGLTMKALVQAPRVGVVCAVIGALTVTLIVAFANPSRQAFINGARWLGLGAPRSLWPDRVSHPVARAAFRWTLWLAVAVAAGYLYVAIATYITTPLFPPAANLVDDRGSGYTGHGVAYVWCRQFIENGLSEELFFRAPLLAAYILVVEPIGRHGGRVRLAAWVLWSGLALAMTVGFALSHGEYGLWNISHALVMGTLNVGLLMASRSVWVPAIAHTTYNTLSAVGVVL